MYRACSLVYFVLLYMCKCTPCVRDTVCHLRLTSWGQCLAGASTSWAAGSAPQSSRPTSWGPLWPSCWPFWGRDGQSWFSPIQQHLEKNLDNRLASIFIHRTSRKNYEHPQMQHFRCHVLFILLAVCLKIKCLISTSLILVNPCFHTFSCRVSLCLCTDYCVALFKLPRMLMSCMLPTRNIFVSAPTTTLTLTLALALALTLALPSPGILSRRLFCADRLRTKLCPTSDVPPLVNLSWKMF